MVSVWSIGKNYIKKYKKKICAIFCKKVIEQQGREIVSEQGKEEVNLVCYRTGRSDSSEGCNSRKSPGIGRHSAYRGIFL